MKKQKPLTKEQYLKQFSRAVRWRLPPQESEDAIADYRELIFQPERDESKLVEELGGPVQAAHLLTDVKTYRRWLKIFAVLAVGLFLLVKWAWTAMIRSAVTVRPASSRTSLMVFSFTDSPASTQPPGRDQRPSVSWTRRMVSP